jgi:hypothetical protein
VLEQLEIQTAVNPRLTPLAVFLTLPFDA